MIRFGLMRKLSSSCKSIPALTKNGTDEASYSQAEIYAAICVACAPSFVKAWNLDFKSTRLYSTLQSLLSLPSSSNQGSYPSARHPNRGQSPSESVSALQKPSSDANKAGFSFSSVHGGAEGYEMQNHEGTGVYRQVTVDVRSQAHNRV